MKRNGKLQIGAGIALVIAILIGVGASTYTPTPMGLFPTTNVVRTTNWLLMVTETNINGKTRLVQVGDVVALGGGGGGGSGVETNEFLTNAVNSGTGILVKNGNAALSRTITGTANEITVANGNGVSGNPTLSLPSGINATKIGGGNVTSSEFDFLDGVTSGIQGQLNGKQASSAVLGNLSNTRAITNVSATFGVLASDILYAPQTITLTNILSQIISNSTHATFGGPVTNKSTTRLVGNVVAQGTVEITALADQFFVGTDVNGVLEARTMSASTLAGRGGGAGAGNPEQLVLGPTLTLPSTTLNVAHNTSTQRVDVAKNSGATTGSRKRINFVEGANVTLTIADDAGNDEVDVTIASSGGGGGSAVYKDAVHTNATFITTTTNMPAGNSPTDGSVVLLEEYVPWTNVLGHSHLTLSIEESWNASGVKSNRVFNHGINVPGTASYVPTNASIWHSWEGDFNTVGSVFSGQAEFHLKAKGTNGAIVRVLGVDAAKGGGISPRLRGRWIGQDDTANNNLWSVQEFGSGASDGGDFDVWGQVSVHGTTTGFGGVGGYFGDNNAAIEMRGVGSGGFYVSHDTANGSTNVLMGIFGTANGFFVIQSETLFEDWIGFGTTAGKPPPIKILPNGTNRLQFATGGMHGGLTNDFVGSCFVQTATAGPTNTTTATQLLNGSGHTNFGVNFFNSVGRTMRINLSGQYSTAATPGTYGWVIQMGSATIATNDLPVPASLSNMGWELDAMLTFRTVGASGTVMCDGAVTLNTNGNTVVRLPLKNTTVDTTVTIDTTAAQNISVRAHTSVTTAPAQIRCSTGKIYLE